MSERTDYEPTGLPRPRLVVGVVAGFVIFAALSMVGLYFVYRPVAYEEPLHVRTFRASRLQIETYKERLDLEAAQRRDLGAAHWRDRAKGVLAIPIGKAMTIVANRGAAAFDPLPGAETGTGAPGERPAEAQAPSDRRPNPGSGAPDPMQPGQDSGTGSAR